MTTIQKIDVAVFAAIVVFCAVSLWNSRRYELEAARARRLKEIGRLLLALVFLFGVAIPREFVFFGNDLSVPLLLAALGFGTYLMRKGSRRV